MDLDTFLTTLYVWIDDWYKAVSELDDKKNADSPLAQYRQSLQQLLSRVTNENGLQKIKKRLVWKFSKAEVAGIMARMERLQSLIAIALEMDHL